MVLRVETVREGVLPAVLVEWTVLDRTYRVLPLIAGLEVGTLDNAATRETEDAWVQVIESLSEVLAHTVLAALPGVGREERDMLDIDRAHRLTLDSTEEHAEASLGEGAGRLDLKGIFLPLLALDDEVLVGELLTLTHGVVIDQLDAQQTLAALRDTCPDGEAVGGILLYCDAEETLVLEAGALVLMARIREAYVVWILVKWAALVHDLELTEGSPAHEVLWELEGAVLDHLGIETAIGCKVDILKEDTILGRGDRGTYLLGLDDQIILGSLSRESNSGTESQSCKDAFCFHVVVFGDIDYVLYAQIRCKYNNYFCKNYIFLC